jgi:O-antigen ligase
MNTVDRLGIARGYCLAFFPYLLIFTETATNVLIGLFGLLTLWETYLVGSWKIKLKPFIIAIAPYLATVGGMMYTSDVEAGWKDLEIRASLLIFPLLFSMRESTSDQRKKFTTHLCYALVLAWAAALVMAVYRNSLDQKLREGWFIKWYYQYNDLTDPLGIDPLYISFYLSFACILLVIEILYPRFEMTGIAKKRKVMIMVVMLIFLAMIGTRSWMIIIFFLGVFLAFLTWKTTSVKLRLTLVVLPALILVLAFALPITRERFIGSFTKQWNFTNYTLERLVIWSTAGSFVMEHPADFVFGCGTNCSTRLMEDIYAARHINWDFDQKTNTHNQYLNFVLNQGFVGLSILMAYLLFSAIYFLKKESRAGFYFMLLLSLGMLTENYMDRQKGVVFIGLTYSLLYFQSKQRDVAMIQNKMGPENG